MEKRVHYFLSRKNVLTWLLALGLTASAAARIIFACDHGLAAYHNFWIELILPVFATLLYVLIALLSGKERSIPIWTAAGSGSIAAWRKSAVWIF